MNNLTATFFGARLSGTESCPISFEIDSQDGDTVTETHDTELERKLAEGLRSYAGVYEKSKDSEQAEVELRHICSTMARLLARLLLTDERWNEYWWIDDVIPVSATFSPFRQLKVRGLMLWGQKGNTRQWVEPCSMQVSETIDGALHYQILCGDAFRGLGKVAYDLRHKGADGVLPDQWQFVFSNEPLRGR